MPTCLGDSIEAPVSLLLSNNKSLLQSTSFNWTFFFVLAFHLHFCNLCQVLSAISTLFADCLAVWNRREWLTINLIRLFCAALSAGFLMWNTQRVPFLSTAPPPVMSLSKSMRRSRVSRSFLVTDVSQSAADLGDTGASRSSVHFHGLAVIGICRRLLLILSHFL